MPRLLTILFLLVIAPSVGFAQADPERDDPPDAACETDMDCGPSEVCETYEWEACPSCIEPDPGEDPDPCECTTGSDSFCAPAPPPSCDASNPCPTDLVCVTFVYESCEGGGSLPPCEPGENCTQPDPEPEPTCTTDSESVCVPPYIAPCQVDSDCGPGFTCEQEEICQCSSGSRPDPGTDPDEEPVDGECSCEPTGGNYCQLVEQECDADSECAGTLVCESFGDVVRCATPIDGTDSEPCDQPDDTSYCVPPDFEYWGYGEGGADRVASATGNEEGTLKSADREGFFGGERDGTKGDVGGCSSTNGSVSWAMLLLLGLALVRRRRQQ